MRRPILRALALVGALSVLSATTAAEAQTPPVPETAGSSWAQPGTEPLDGMGAWVYVVTAAPGSAAAPAAYDYVLLFVFGAGNDGAVGLGTDAVTLQRFAGFATGGGATIHLPYEWQTGHFYYLLTYRLGPDLWGGWVYDHAAAAWTFIGQIPSVPDAGLLRPGTAFTDVEWDGPTASCAAYPRTEAYFYNPLGYRGSSFTLATLLGHTTNTGAGCPTQATTDFGWADYQAGAAGA